MAYDPVLPAGSVFADYIIDDVLARGGMGVVYRATQQHPRRRVALKLITPERAADPAYRERFLREMDTLASIEHPNIVPIHAAGEWQGQLYLAMRLVDGPDLGALIAREGPMSLDRALRLVAPVADALEAAHAAGLVHRDVKPANILVDSRGAVYLTDFGLTKRSISESGPTMPGQAIGSPGYMSPEQFTTGISPDPVIAGRTDQYALACVLFACLTGKEPYHRDTWESAMWAHVYAPVPLLSERRPDLPPALDGVLETALAKDPTARYRSVDAFIDALRVAAASPAPIPAGAGETVPDAPADRRRLGPTPPAPPIETGSPLPPPPGPVGPPPAPADSTGQGTAGDETVAWDIGSTRKVPRPRRQDGGTGMPRAASGPPLALIAGVGAIGALVVVVLLFSVVLSGGASGSPKPSSSSVADTRTPSPVPTAAGSFGPLPSAVFATYPPTAAPATPTTGPADRKAAMARLRAMIPAAIEKTCVDVDSSFEALATVACTTSGTSFLEYAIFPDEAALDKLYALSRDTVHVSDGAGQCPAPAGESTWSFDSGNGPVQGHVYCADGLTGGLDAAIVGWTHAPQLVYVEMYGPKLDPLFARWTSGDVLIAP